MSLRLTRFFTVILFAIAVLPCTSQVPDSISYQAVVRDAFGEVLANQSVTIEFAIRHGATDGTIVFEENHDLIPTNEFGLFSAMIGGGTNTGVGIYNTLGEIPWADGSYFLEVRAAIPGSGGTEIIGVSQMLTVPYAFYASQAGTVVNETDGDPTNELIDDFSMDGNTLLITENGIDHAVDLSGFSGGPDEDADAGNELISDMSLSATNQLSITEGGVTTSCDLSPLTESPWIEADTGVYCPEQNVGIGTVYPSSTLAVDGSVALGVTSVTGQLYDLSANGENASTSVFICNVTTQDVTIALMSATLCPGRMYMFRKIFTGVVTSNDVNISAVPGETIDGLDIYEMTHVYAEYLTIISDGSNWYVIDHNKE